MSVENAIKKIKDEMKKDKASYVQVVGKFLLNHLEVNPTDANKIMIKDKTITKSLAEMRKVAEKQKVGNCAVLSDQEGFGVVLKYFGIDTKPSKDVVKATKNVTETTNNVTESVDFDVSLDDFL